MIAAYANNTSSEQELIYEVTVGSTYSFTETIGLKVSGSAGIPFVTKGSVEISGEISATQAFQKQVRTSVSAIVQPGMLVVVYQAVLTQSVYYLLPLVPGANIFFWAVKNDIIETNSFEVDESPLPEKVDAALRAAA